MVELINAPKPKGTVLDRKISNARKEHQCHTCKKTIEKKMDYVILCISNEPFNNIFLKYHLECEPGV